MKIVTTETIPGAQIEALGLVRASVVRARHLGSDIGAGLKGLVGGKIRGYEKLLATAREEVLTELMESAASMDADGIVCVRMQTSDIMQGATEVMAYGTAVKIRNG